MRDRWRPHHYRHCERSEAIQRAARADWIASSQVLLAMTAEAFLVGTARRCAFAHPTNSTHHFSASATLARPALAQTSSFSPPGAPETPTPPIGSLPARIGTPPPTPTTLGIWRMKALAGSSSSFMVCSEVWLRVRAV